MKLILITFMLTVQTWSYDFDLFPENECTKVGEKFSKILGDEGCKLTELASGKTMRIETVFCDDPKHLYHGKVLKTLIAKTDDTFAKAANEVKVNKILRGADYILASIPGTCRYHEIPHSVVIEVYFAMDRAKSDLAKHVQEEGFQLQDGVFHKTEHLRLFKILLWMDQLLQGLITMQVRRIMHNDLKMENIFLKNEFEVWIADFGEAYHSKKNENGDLTYKTDYVVGTETYFSKDHAFFVEDEEEQLDYNTLTDKTDVYVMGLVFFRILNPKENMKFDETRLAQILNKDRSVYGTGPSANLSRKDRAKAQYIYEVVRRYDEVQFDKIYAPLNELIRRMTKANPNARLNAVQAYELFTKIARYIIDSFTDAAGTGDKISSDAFVRDLITKQAQYCTGKPKDYIAYFMNGPKVLPYIIKSSSIRAATILKPVSTEPDIQEKIDALDKLISNDFGSSDEPDEVEEEDSDVYGIKEYIPKKTMKVENGVLIDNYVGASANRVRLLI